MFRPPSVGQEGDKKRSHQDLYRCATIASMARRAVLTTESWASIRPLRPAPQHCADGRGRPWRAAREVMNGSLWMLRRGARWRAGWQNVRRLVVRPEHGAENFPSFVDLGCLVILLRGSF